MVVLNVSEAPDSMDVTIISIVTILSIGIFTGCNNCIRYDYYAKIKNYTDCNYCNDRTDRVRCRTYNKCANSKG